MIKQQNKKLKKASRTIIIFEPEKSNVRDVGCLFHKIFWPKDGKSYP